ncbi:MAG: hypothetical protein HY360_09625 [Verrucomicrobia bacterium]|nr:hypothetical protein [Verrucomicrobiota bacterium]
MKKPFSQAGWIVALTIVLLPLDAAEPAADTVTVQLKSRQSPVYEGKKRLWQTLVMTNRLTEYDLNIASDLDENGDTVNTTLGIANPNQSLWWTGFMNLKIDGVSVEQSPCAVSILDQGQQGCLELLYKRPEGDVRCRLLLRPDDEMLYVEWACDGPSTGEKHLEIVCAPAVANSIPGQTAKELGTRRAVRTIAQTIEEGNETASVNSEKENWALFLDQVWDMADETKRTAPLRSGVTGPAGVVFQPLPKMEVRYELDQFFVRAHVTYPSEVNIVRLAVCEFRRLGNEKAFQTLKETAPAALERMKQWVAVPRELAGVTVETVRRQADSLLKQTTNPQTAPSTANLQSRLQRFVETGAKWDKERRIKPVAADRAFQSAYEELCNELERFHRSTRKDGKILVLKGLYNLLYQLDETQKKYPGLMREVKNVYVRKDFNYGFYADDFPSTTGEILQFDAIILANADIESVREEGVRLLCNYVKNGGGLVVLGGYHSYGLSAIYDTPLGAMLPVKSAAFDLQPFGAAETNSTSRFMSSGAPLQAAPANTLFTANLKWDLKPRCYWQHRVKPASDAQVHVTAGAEPFLVSSQAGKGRIAAVTGTVLGSPPDGSLPFWEWESWPELLARIIAWAADKPLK